MAKLGNCLQFCLKPQKQIILMSESIHLLKKILQQFSAKQQSHLGLSTCTAKGRKYSTHSDDQKGKEEGGLYDLPMSSIDSPNSADERDAHNDITNSQGSIKKQDTDKLENCACISTPHDNGYPSALKTVSVVPGKGKPPEPPVTCCGTGCANCVWIVYAEQLKEYYKDGGEQARKALDQIEDPSLKAFIKLELGL